MIKLTLATVLLLMSPFLFAAHSSNSQIDELLASTTEPDGIVFEVLSWDKNTWTWAAPLIKDYRNQLLKKFPELDIAIVSHGAEQFQLTKDEAQNQPEAISSLESLTTDGVNLHVCGTHSSWNDISEDSYIDIVDVSPSGPAQINDYINLGYIKVLIKQPSH